VKKNINVSFINLKTNDDLNKKRLKNKNVISNKQTSINNSLLVKQTKNEFNFNSQKKENNYKKSKLQSKSELHNYSSSFKPTKNSIRLAASHSSWSMTDKEINPSPKGADLNLQRFNSYNINSMEFTTFNLYNKIPLPNTPNVPNNIKHRKGV